MTIRKKQTHKELVDYLYAACFSPLKSTWLKAIKKNIFLSWPGIQEDLVQMNLSLKIVTAQGHMHRERQQLQSTKRKDTKQCSIPMEDVFFPQSETPSKRTNKVAYMLINQNEFSTAYQDLTGKFSMKSSRGNEYILIGYHYNANSIIQIPVKNRVGTDLRDEWQQLHCIFPKQE